MAEQLVTVNDEGRGIPRLSLLSKVGYGLGDLASNLSWIFIGSYFVIFLTDVAGIEAAIVSVMLLATKVWDGVNDPIVGAIEEQTKSRFGRFRPWILYCSPLLAIVNILCFTAPFSGAVAKVIWGCIGYILIDTFYGMVNLAYGALSTVMTYDPKERTELSAWRMIGQNVGSVILSLISMPLILFFSGGEKPIARGYTITTAIYAIAAIPMFLILFFNSREAVKPVEERKVPIKETIRVVLTNKPLVYIFFMSLFYMTGFIARLGIVVYYYIYILKRFDLIGPLMMLPHLFAAGTMFFSKSFIDRIGKKRSIAIGCIVIPAVLFLIFLIDPTASTTLLFIFTALYGIALGLLQPTVMARVPDAIDYMEDKTGVRADGTSYTAISLSTKIAAAIGVSIGLAIMGAFGYAANMDQSAKSIQGINIAANLFPAACFLLTLIPLVLYKLTPERNAEIRERLQKKVAAKIDGSL
ncbi:MAG: MFS transporter [Treponema sp.]|jgi:GPH family glycoside/pentoside/hexuronide:cation symporter/probable glucitol transport protein GutA|nr:MFS transporter [Treponema sp.]